ncbi:Maf family protein [uncultured Ruminococcus sp.]|uniref:Maf family protein n=1 Tax=uncultured Ruminococcus sp. TaxID=165186 RepID=UPI0025DD3464|nr:Maf family protein [uncultured Ruminococcus sp.]
MTTKNLLTEYDVILASASPRRKELIQLVCGNFRIIPADCGEEVPEGMQAEKIPEYLSAKKCECISEVYGRALVIGCDTVVINDGKVLGKPADEEDAAQMLRSLSGRTHKVITGCTISCGERQRSFSVCTEVTFRELSDDDIEEYVATGEPMDKAGAYGIQGKGALFVEKINGDYYNVVGLPVSELAVQLADFVKK